MPKRNKNIRLCENLYINVYRGIIQGGMALFMFSIKWKPSSCPSSDPWINKMCYIHTIEYHSWIKGVVARGREKGRRVTAPPPTPPPPRHWHSTAFLVIPRRGGDRGDISFCLTLPSLECAACGCSSVWGFLLGSPSWAASVPALFILTGHETWISRLCGFEKVALVLSLSHCIPLSLQGENKLPAWGKLPLKPKSNTGRN